MNGFSHHVSRTIQNPLAGATGTTGATGPAGPAGPAGSPSAVRVDYYNTVGAARENSITAKCVIIGKDSILEMGTFEFDSLFDLTGKIDGRDYFIDVAARLFKRSA